MIRPQTAAARPEPTCATRNPSNSDISALLAETMHRDGMLYKRSPHIPTSNALAKPGRLAPNAYRPVEIGAQFVRPDATQSWIAEACRNCSMTNSTTRTSATIRPNPTTARSGPPFGSSCSAIASFLDRMAGDLNAPNHCMLRFFLATPRVRQRATRMKRAPGWRRDRAWYLTPDRRPGAADLLQVGDRVQQQARVGVTRCS